MECGTFEPANTKDDGVELVAAPIQKDSPKSTPVSIGSCSRPAAAVVCGKKPNTESDIAVPILKMLLPKFQRVHQHFHLGFRQHFMLQHYHQHLRQHFLVPV